MKHYCYICLAIVPALFFAITTVNKTSITSSLFVENIEALSECEATFPNASGQIVTIWCKGSKGTCHIKRKEKVNTSYGTFDVWVDATCDGIEVKQ